MSRTKYSRVSTDGGRSSRTWHRSAVHFHALSASICLAISICFILSSTLGGAVGATELFSGHCNHAININRVLQAILALLAIGISTSSDFFLRLASSPTVDDLKEAHTQGRSLDIAVHSFRNVRRISYWRTFGWIMLILPTIPIQLLFHSVTFVCFPSTEYSRFLVSEAFTTGAAFAYPGVALFSSQSVIDQASSLRSQFDGILPSLKSASSEWERLEASDCLRAYMDLEGLQKHRNLMLVVEAGPDADAKGWTGAHVWNDTRPPAYFMNDSINEYDPELTNSLWSFSMSCRLDLSTENAQERPTRCRLSYDDYAANFDFEIVELNTVTEGWDIWYPDSMSPTFWNPSVRYCLSEPYLAPCKVYVSNCFLLITIFCILLGCTCSILITRFSWHKITCQSIGDVLEVFLKDGEAFIQRPATSPARCNLEGAALGYTRCTPVSTWIKTSTHWGQAVSNSLWLWTCIPIGLLMYASSAVLVLTWGIGLSYKHTLGEGISNNLHSPDYAMFAPTNSTLRLAVYCLVVNAPQLGISIYYFVFSSLYSTLFQAKYWADFTVKAQPLRVSFPHEELQEGTPPLQFPWIWGLSFILLKASIGWCLTQSFYLVPIGNVSTWHADFQFDDLNFFIGYSMRAMILTAAVAAVAVSIPLVLSVRHLPPAAVVVGTDSAAIAAYCPTNTILIRHQGSTEGNHGAIAAWDDIWRSRRHLQPLRWGVLNLGSAMLGRPGVLGLGTEDEVLGLPVEGQNYVSVAGHFKLYASSALAAAEATR